MKTIRTAQWEGHYRDENYPYGNIPREWNGERSPA